MIDDRADSRFDVGRVAHFQRFDLGNKSSHKFVVAALVHNNPIDGHADLALMQEFTEHRSLRGLLHIGIIQHHKGAVTTEFQRDFLDVVAAGGNAADVFTHRGRSGKRNQRRGRVGHKVVTNIRTGTHHNAQHTYGQPRFFENTGQQKAAGNRRVAGGLDDYRVTKRQRRCYGTLGQVQGKVPGADHSNHP